jgi:methyl-accepting chemotaxis protein
MSWLINVVTICVIFLAAMLLWSLSKKVAENDTVASNRFYSVLLADELRKSSEELTRQVQMYAATGKSSAEEAYNKVLDVRNGQVPRPANSQIAPGQKRALLDLLMEYGATEDEFALIKKASSLSDALVALEVESMNAVKGIFKDSQGQYTIRREPNKELALKLVFSEAYFSEVKKIMVPMDEFRERIFSRTGGSIKTAAREQHVALLLSAFALAMIFLTSFVNFLYNHFSVILPLSKITKVLGTVIDNGKTDLRKQINLQNKNEIGNLAIFFNKLMSELRNSMSRTKTAVDSLVALSKGLFSVSNKLTDGSKKTVSQSNTVTSTSENISDNINAMANAAENASNNVNEVAGSAEEMSVNMSTIAAAVEEMSASISQIASNASEARKVAGEANAKSGDATSTMNKLGISAKEIGQVTGVIKRIAEKTNLLALNATIEAASAGVAGKGFAVVASEIKELAHQSALSADDIARKIESIQGETSNAVAVISDVSDIIAKINQSVDAIAGHVDQQTKAANEIASNVAQANIGAKRVAGSISEVAGGMNKVSKNAAEVASGTANVNKNIVSMNQIAKESAESANEVNHSSGDLEIIAEDIKEALNAYLV